MFRISSTRILIVSVNGNGMLFQLSGLIDSVRSGSSSVTDFGLLTGDETFDYYKLLSLLTAAGLFPLLILNYYSYMKLI